MGYSCTQDADSMLGVIRHIFGDGKSGNVLTISGRRYFFERGREQSDGAITGTLMLMVGTDSCKRAGSFRIAADGSIARFPALSQTEKREATDTFNDMRARNPMLLRSWSMGVL